MATLRPIRQHSAPSLPSMLLRAYSVDPRDRVICAVAGGRFSTVAEVIPAALAVLRVAAEIEPVPGKLLHWYQHDAIAELGFLTPEQLVSLGRADTVIDFLRSILGAERD